MKTAKEWIAEISESGKNHTPACVCERCKTGRETFLLEDDIKKIQRDTFLAAADIAERISQHALQDDPATGEVREGAVATSDGAFQVVARLFLEAEKLYVIDPNDATQDTTVIKERLNRLLALASDCIDFDPENQVPVCKNCGMELEKDGTGHKLNCLADETLKSAVVLKPRGN